jgi:hypothetical protein
MSLLQLIWLLLLKFTWYATFNVFIAAYLSAAAEVYLVHYIQCLYCSLSVCCCSSLLGTLHLMSSLQLIWLLLLKFTWYATFNVFIAAHLSAAAAQVYLVRYI